MNEVELELYKLGVPAEHAAQRGRPGSVRDGSDLRGREPGGGPPAAHDVDASQGRAEVRPGLPPPRKAVPGRQRERQAPELVVRHRQTRTCSSPARRPHENMQFLFFCSAVLKAVARHQDLLRARSRPRGERPPAGRQRGAAGDHLRVLWVTSSGTSSSRSNRCGRGQDVQAVRPARARRDEPSRTSRSTRATGTGPRPSRSPATSGSSGPGRLVAEHLRSRPPS